MAEAGTGAMEKDMTANVNAADTPNEIAALRRMTVKDLRRRHVELFGEESQDAVGKVSEVMGANRGLVP